MNSPKISVIIPVYNVKEYLKQCIKSVEIQTYKNLEIIIVDDGSSDGSERICDEIKKLHPDYIVIHKENGGLSDARNVGIERSTGDFISFLDSDDIISPIYYEIVVKALNTSHCDMAVIKQPVRFWDGDEVHLTDSIDRCSFRITASRDSLLDMLYLSIATGAPYKIVRKSILESIHFPKGMYYEDLATTYKFFLATQRIVLIEGSLYGYRKRMDGIIRQDFTEKKLTIIDVTRQLENDFESIHDLDLKEAAIYRVFPALFSVFLQVPSCCEERRKLWDEVIRHRKEVLFSRHKIRMKDRIAAFLSYFGMSVSWTMGRVFGQRNTIRQ